MPPGERPATAGGARPDAGRGPHEIRLEVPADGRFARVVRVAASALAVRAGHSVVVVEDLRIALDEALILLLRRIPRPLAPPSDEAQGEADTFPGEGWAPTLVVVMRVGAGPLEVELSLRPPPPAHVEGPDDLEARERYEELTPPRVRVRHLDPAAGVVALVTEP